MNREPPSDRRLDEALQLLDALAPPPRAGLQDEVLREFQRHGPRPLRRPWLPATFCAMAAGFAALLVTLAPRGSDPGPAEPASRIARRVEQAGRALQDLELRLLGDRLSRLEERVHAAALELDAGSPEPVAPPPPLIEGAEPLSHRDQVATLRLAFLEQSNAGVLGVDGLSRRLEELAGAYDGTVAARRARQWADRLRP